MERAASMDRLRQDVRDALRSLALRPGYAAAVIATWAVGLGATLTLFTVVWNVVLEPLPYPDPERLVRVYETDPHNGSYREAASVPDFRDFRQRSESFAALAGVRTRPLNLSPARPSAGGGPRRVQVAGVSPELFSMLGARPAAGRLFGSEEDTPGGPRVAVLSTELWRERFGRDGGVVGSTLLLDGEPYEVVGVAGAGMDVPGEADLWIPFTALLDELAEERGVHDTRVFGRLAAGASLATARAEMDAVAARLAGLYPESNEGRGVRLMTLREAMVGDVRPALLTLLGAVGLLLLLAGVNAAGLMLARAARRSREIGIRVALGAGRRRLMGQLLTESVLLSSTAGCLGLLAASWGVGLLRSTALADLPRAASIGVDPVVASAGLALAVAAGAVFGLAPALQISRGEVARVLRSAGPGAPAASGRTTRTALVVAQIALAAVLAVGSGLLVRSVWNLLAVDPGFGARSVLTVELSLPASRYPAERERYPRLTETIGFYERVLERVGRVPGVVSAAAALNPPLEPGWTTRLTVDGRPVEDGPPDEVRFRPVTPGYFRTAGIDVVRGRGLTARDRLDAPNVLLVNEALARRYFPDEDPVGRSVTFWGESRRIVGVVEDVRFMGLDRDSEPAIYPALAQVPITQFHLVVRTAVPPLDLAPAVRSAVWSVDPELAPFDVTSMERALDAALGRPRLHMGLMTGFALAALLLAGIGVYGLVAGLVTERTHETGVRMALGAGRVRVLLGVLRSGAGLAAAGLAVGLLCALVLSETLDALLFGVAPIDPTVLVVVGAVLLGAALLASFVPARRASRLDPVEALRQE